MKEYRHLVSDVATKAGEAIMDVYLAGNFGIELKNDHSPLTRADKVAHQVIEKGLKHTKIPILSEEGSRFDFETRKAWNRFWLVDPLDGTKEFIKKNGEFSVNIALIENGIATFGVVYIPVTKELFVGGANDPAIKTRNGIETKLNKRNKSTTLDSMKKMPNCRIAASRSHLNRQTRNFMDDFIDPRVVSMGSSLKFMAVIDGKADLYPRFAPTMEWDTAASHAIVNSLGYKVVNLSTGLELTYNKQNLLNPYFICY